MFSSYTAYNFVALYVSPGMHFIAAYLLYLLRHETISFGRRNYMYKRCKLKVFSLEFSDSIFGQNNFLCSDWMVASAKKPEHGRKLDASGLYASGRTQSEINIYSSKLIIVKMTFQLGRFDSSYKKTMEIKTLKRTCI